MLAEESDEELREMIWEEIEQAEEKIPGKEQEIKMLLVPADPEDNKNAILRFVQEPAAMRQAFLPATFFGCIPDFVKEKGGGWKLPMSMREPRADIRKLLPMLRATAYMEF